MHILQPLVSSHLEVRCLLVTHLFYFWTREMLSKYENLAPRVGLEVSRIFYLFIYFFPKGCVVLALTPWNIAVVVLINCFNGDMIAADLWR